MLGSRLGRLTLAAVVDYDVAVGSGLAEENERARTGLTRMADATGLRPETLLLSGRPAEVLRKYAVEEGYDLIVVGVAVTARAVFSSGALQMRSHAAARCPCSSSEH